MKRKTIARLIAVLLIGYGFAFLTMRTDASNMTRYRTLSHEALLAELKEKNNDSFDSAFFTSLLVVGLVTFSVEGVAALIVIAMNRIAPLPVVLDPAQEAEIAAGPHFH